MGTKRLGAAGLVLSAGLVWPMGGSVSGQTPLPAIPGGGGAEVASPARTAAVTFQMVRPGLVVPRLRILLREDGTGSYAGEEVTPPTTDGRAPTTSQVAREITVGALTTVKIFRVARAERFFNISCASKAKNIADTGAKTLSYAGPDGKGSCDYNYSENKNVVMLTELFLGIAATIDEGRRLEFKHRFDHLGLDAELDTLTQSNESGRAVELVTIAPVLRQLADDTELMQRVRSRAAKLLDRAGEGK